MRVTERIMVDNLVRNIGIQAEDISTMQDQLSSGKRLRRPSDDPQSTNRALTLSAELDRNGQYLRGIPTARGWLEASDSALSHMSDVLTRVRDLALRGLSDSIGADGRKQLGMEVDSLLDELVQSANATHEGKYLFSGRKITTTPFTATSVAGRIVAVDYRPGDPAGQLTQEIAKGVAVVVNVSGDQTVSGSAPMQSAMDAMISLRKWLEGDPTGTADVNAISTALDGISSLRGIVGGQSRRIDGAETVLNDEKLNLSAMLSQAQDTDVAEVLSKLMAQENVYKAALNVGAQVIQPSLLDFLR